jgi:hypothetical protein
MSLRVLSSGLVALGVALSIVSTAVAQGTQQQCAACHAGAARNPAVQQPQIQPIKTGGALVATGQNQIQLSTGVNQTLLVMTGPNTQVSVAGTAEQDYLKSGVTVEFVAEVDKTHAVKEKIGHLLIVSPTTDRPIGLFPPESATPEKKGEKGEKSAKATEGKANPLTPGPGIGGAVPAKARSTAPQFPGTFTVRGTIKSSKSGEITVAAGRASIKAELANDATIDVDMDDVRIAQPGDKVTVSGFASKALPNVVMAEAIKIELANPLSGAKKPVTRPAKTPAAGKAKKGP